MNILSFDIGTRHLAYCLVQYQNSNVADILEWKLIDLVKELQNTKRITPEALTVFLNAKFQSILPKLHTVLIENQVQNSKMKNIQMILHTYFAMQNGIQIHVCNANQKYEGTGLQSYGKRKKYSVETIRAYLRNEAHLSKYLHHLDLFRKKDDLTDSLLQIIVWGKNN